MSKVSRINARAFLLATSMAMSTAAVAADSYYVDPVAGNDKNNGLSTATAFRSIDRARAVVATQNKQMTADINVYLRRGIHTVARTLTFGPGDSGTNGFFVNYVAMPGETPEISGGRRVTGWTAVPGTPLWQASVAPSAGYSSYFRQLYVNDRRALIAEQQKYVTSTGYYDDPATPEAVDGLRFNAADLASNYTNPSDLVLFHYKIWKEDRLPVTQLIRAGSEVILRTAQPGTQTRATRGMFDPGEPWKIQNAFEELDQPGEFYLNQATHVVYYHPKPGEDMTTANVVVPVVEKVIAFTGNTSKVRNIRLQGLKIGHGNWLFPKNNLLGGTQAEALYDPATGTSTYDLEVPGDIVLNQTDNIQLIRNVIRNSAGSGVQVYNGAINTVIQGNVVYGTTAAGISVGRLDQLWKGVADQNIPYEEQSEKTLINNNIVADTGEDYWQATGISLMNTMTATVTHNVVFHTSYMGIHQRAGETGVPQPALVGKSDIGFNHVYDANWSVLSDNGAIYTFGMYPGSVIHDNFVQDNKALSSFYNDNMSFENTLRNNALLKRVDMASRAYKKTTPYAIYAIDNKIMASGSSWFYTQLTNNILVPDWQGAARPIIKLAGLEPEFADIATKMPLLHGNNLATSARRIGDSGGWTGLDRLSDGTITTGKATNESGAEARVEFDSGGNYGKLIFTMKEDNDGPYQVTDWKVQRYSNSAAAWVDVFGWQPGESPVEQVYYPTSTIQGIKFRLHVRNTNPGGKIGVQEFTMRGSL